MFLMFQPFKKYVDFKGRARRAEYWQYTLFFLVFYAPLSFLGRETESDPDSVGFRALVSILLLLFVLPTFLPTLAVGVRRMHDIDKSGWWVLIPLIPIIGTIIWVVFAARDGTAGSNRFGADPKGRAQELGAPVVVS